MYSQDNVASGEVSYILCSSEKLAGIRVGVAAAPQLKEFRFKRK